MITPNAMGKDFTGSSCGLAVLASDSGRAARVARAGAESDDAYGATAAAPTRASDGTPRYESATTQALTVSTHEITSSLHWKASGPAMATGTHTRIVNAPISTTESAAASAARMPETIASPAAM